MSDPALRLRAPVAIGGIGGSGTRLGARLLQMLGRYIGADLNEALDNLWFTLLFKRSGIFLATDDEFAELAALFWARMEGRLDHPVRATAQILQLASQSRPQHDRDWLGERARSFLDTPPSRPRGAPWGWKEPNTHLIIDRLLSAQADLRYIHFVRHPLDMALSTNQNQLKNWGTILLNRTVSISPQDSLTYWCAADRRITRIANLFPGRVLRVDFDQLCLEPETEFTRIAAYLGEHASGDLKAAFRAGVDAGRPGRGRFRTADAAFADTDLEYVVQLGYDIS